MVGVPGRSKACQTCKSRHIPCDLLHLKQAACGPCTKSKRVCRSLHAHIFVNHDEGTHKSVYRKVDGKRDQKSWHLSTESVEKFSSTELRNGTRAKPNLSPYPVSLPGSITDTALVRQQFLANAKIAVRDGGQGSTEFPPFCSSAITSQSMDSWAFKTSPALACYTSWLGRMNGDPNFIEASRKLYVQGLKEVQQSVNDPHMALLDETISACIGLIIYEVLECPDRSYSAYHKHIDGCSALIKLRGVHAHRDGVGHDLFRGFRYIAILKALQDHRSTYLIDPIWSEAPFSIHPKSTHDKLLDLLATGASFLGESDRFASTPPSQILPALLDMDGRLRDLDIQLNEIHTEMTAMHEGPLFWPMNPAVQTVGDGASNTIDGPGFGPPICFVDEEIARTLTLYWAQQTLLQMGRAEIHVGLAGMAAAGMVQGYAERVNAALSQPSSPMIETAHLVLRSRDYCCGTLNTVLRYSVPLNMTLDVLANKPVLYGEEIKFAKAVKRQISQRHLRITQYTSTLKYVKDI